MKMKNMNFSMLLAVLAVAGLASATVYGRIIPSAQQAKDHAAAPEASSVITAEDGDWVLTLPERPEIPAPPAVVPALEVESKILPIAGPGLEHGLAPDNSPVIDLIEGEWVLSPSSMTPPAVDEALYLAAASTGSTSYGTASAMLVVPEPATLLLLGLGGLVIRRRFAH